MSTPFNSVLRAVGFASSKTDYYDFDVAGTHRAKKPRKCGRCQHWIHSDQVYVSVGVQMEGEYSQWNLCLPCAHSDDFQLYETSHPVWDRHGVIRKDFWDHHDIETGLPKIP